MKSIAIWYSPIDKRVATLSEIELHFNFWKIPNGASMPTKFLDIGLKLENTVNIKSVNIYFPRVIAEHEFEDIVSKFIHKPDLVSAIFNENYKVVSESTSKAYEIKDTRGEFVFDIYKTSPNDLEYRQAYGGTIISIDVPKQIRRSYYRFRVTGAFIHSLSTLSRPANSILDSAFSEIEMIDFRANEIRDLDPDLLERIRGEVFPRIRKQHFFFICSSDEDIIENLQPFSSCRNLENYRWNDYVSIPKINDKVFLAYHWKETDKESIANLIRIKYEKNNWKTIAKYFAVGFIIAVVIELFSNWLYDYIKK